MPSSARNNGADGKDRGVTKKPKGSSGSKVGESAKATSGSGNNGGSQRCRVLMMFQYFFFLDTIFRFILDIGF